MVAAAEPVQEPGRVEVARTRRVHQGIDPNGVDDVNLLAGTTREPRSLRVNAAIAHNPRTRSSASSKSSTSYSEQISASFATSTSSDGDQVAKAAVTVDHDGRRLGATSARPHAHARPEPMSSPSVR